MLSRWIDDGVAVPPAHRAGIPEDYLDLIGRRSLLVDRLADGAAAPLTPVQFGARPARAVRQIGAELVDALAASLFVDDPRLFDGYVGWLVDMLYARQVPRGAVWGLLDLVHHALADIPRAQRFIAASRSPRGA